MQTKQKKIKRVLIVDDEPALLLSIEAGFEEHEHDFQILTALNGRDGLDILKSARIDLVISDLRMPEMDGFEFIRILNLEFSHIPRIVMSAYGTPMIEKQLLAHGILSFLDKPVDFDTLQNAIISALETTDNCSCT